MTTSNKPSILLVARASDVEQREALPAQKSASLNTQKKRAGVSTKIISI